ncbi:hypothetical protein Tco_0834957 [Tanacetum coccineum]
MVQSQLFPSTTILKALTINQVWKDWYLTSWHLKTPGLSKFEADFKRQQGEMTNKIDSVLKGQSPIEKRRTTLATREPRCMAWLDYDEHVDSLSTIDNEVGVTSPKSTAQTLPSFEECTPLVTYPEEVEKTLGTDRVPSFDGPEPQPLLNSLSLDVSLGEVIFDEKRLGSS